MSISIRSASNFIIRINEPGSHMHISSNEKIQEISEDVYSERKWT